MTGITSRPKLVTVFGGSGFIGRHLVQALARRGHRVRVAVRRPDLAGHLQPLGAVGQIKAVQANLRYRWSVDRAVQGADTVVNLVGILYEAGRQSFDAVQSFGPSAIGEACRAAGIRSVVHMSAIGADAGSDIAYLRSKGEGEAGITDAVPETVSMRPSIVFGPEDSFFNKFADMARLAPALPLIGGGTTRFQPVYVGDVAEAFTKAVDGEAAPGTVYELGGPDILSFRHCLEMVLAVTGRKRPFVPLPFAIARPLGRVLGMLPKPPMTFDQVRMLQFDNVVSDAAISDGRTLAGLGISPHAISAILPTYLGRFRDHGQFARPTTGVSR